MEKYRHGIGREGMLVPRSLSELISAAKENFWKWKKSAQVISIPSNVGYRGTNVIVVEDDKVNYMLERIPKELLSFMLNSLQAIPALTGSWGPGETAVEMLENMTVVYAEGQSSMGSLVTVYCDIADQYIFFAEGYMDVEGAGAKGATAFKDWVQSEQKAGKLNPVIANTIAQWIQCCMVAVGELIQNFLPPNYRICGQMFIVQDKVVTAINCGIPQAQTMANSVFTTISQFTFAGKDTKNLGHTLNAAKSITDYASIIHQYVIGNNANRSITDTWRMNTDIEEIDDDIIAAMVCSDILRPKMFLKKYHRFMTRRFSELSVYDQYSIGYVTDAGVSPERVDESDREVMVVETRIGNYKQTPPVHLDLQFTAYNSSVYAMCVQAWKQLASRSLLRDCLKSSVNEAAWVEDVVTNIFPLIRSVITKNRDAYFQIYRDTIKPEYQTIGIADFDEVDGFLEDIKAIYDEDKEEALFHLKQFNLWDQYFRTGAVVNNKEPVKSRDSIFGLVWPIHYPFSKGYGVVVLSFAYDVIATEAQKACLDASNTAIKSLIPYMLD